MIAGALRRVLLVWFAVAMVLAAPAGAADVLAAADGRHVFVARRSLDAGGWDIVHFDAMAGPDRHRTVFRTARRPEAVAAVGDRCVLVLAPLDAERPSRLGVSFRVVQHPLNDVWYADPPGEPWVLPPLPAGGDQVAIESIGEERFLVLSPSERSARGVSRLPGDAGAIQPERADESGGIHRLGDRYVFDWTTLPPPAGFERAIRVVAGKVATGAAPMLQLVWVGADGGWSAARLDGDAWRTSPLDGIDRGEPVSIVTLPDRTLIAVRDVSGLRLFDLLADSDDRLKAREFVTLAPPLAASDAIAVGTVAEPWVIGVEGGTVQVTTVDRGDGRTAGPVMATEVEVDGSLVEFPIYATLMFSVMFATLLLRPHVERQPAVPAEGIVAGGLLRRAAGLCVDLTPGMMAAVLVFDLDPSIFLERVQAGDPKALAPALFGTVVASLLAGVMEVVMGRSLGKLLVGLKVVALDGTPGTPLQRGLRAALRFVVLSFWPIGVLTLVEPLGRGMPELLSRTMVVPAGPPEVSGPAVTTSEGRPPADSD